MGLCQRKVEDKVMGDLTANFSRDEFYCPCGCGLFNMDMVFIKILQDVRTDIGKRVDITSGSRCVERNRDVGGGDNSTHLYGTAVDIYVMGNQYRYTLVQSLYKHGVTRVYIYRGHVHADIKPVDTPVLGWG